MMAETILTDSLVSRLAAQDKPCEVHQESVYIFTIVDRAGGICTS